MFRISLIEITHLKKSFKNTLAIDDLSFTLDNEVLAFLGPNGAGKTTIMNCLLGLIKRDSGTIAILGMDPEKSVNKIRQKVGLVPQETALYEYLTAKENLEFHARVYGIPRSERKKKIKEALELSQLTERANDLVSTFSGGMKRRLALVRSLLHDPDFLFLDEPTLGIDVQNRNEIWERIRVLKETKGIILNTNYMDEAEQIADRCAIIDNGKLIVIDTPANLKKQYAGGTNLRLVVKPGDGIDSLVSQLELLTSDLNYVKNDDESYKFIIPAKEDPNALLTKVTQIMQKTSTTLLDLVLTSPTLDDVFLQLTGKALRD